MSSNIEEATDRKLGVSVTQAFFVPYPIEDVFVFVSADDVLPKILTGYGMLPGVTSVSEVSGPWDRPGSHRIVHLADGSTLRERLTDYIRLSYFAYEVSNPSFALKHLMTKARGQFRFESVDGGTAVKWTYTFYAKNRVTRMPLMFFVRSQWKGYMNTCVANILAHFGSAP